LSHDLTAAGFFMRILILKPSSLGDVVQALPVLRLLKLHSPASEIYWWLSADLLPLLQGDPDLTGVFSFERRRWAHPWHWDEMIRSVRAMRELQFDYAIDLQGLARSGIFAWLARANVTIGLDEAREGARALYDVAVPRPSPLTHAIDWYLEVLRVMKVPVHRNFTWIPQRGQAVESLVQKWPRALTRRWIVIHPGARWLNKRWPVEFYRQLVSQMTSNFSDVDIAILGGREDRSLAESVAQGNPERCLNLAAKTSLLEMIEWIRLSDLMISNDSGPMHVAAALGKPLVAIFGPTEPRRTGPYGSLDDAIRVSLPCAPCLKSTCMNVRPLECLRGIGPSAVFERVRQRLA
jgi:heptosyltransferase I